MNDVPGCPAPRVALISSSLNLGGSTTFLCNLGGELVRRGIPCRVYSLSKNNPLASDFALLKVPTSVYDEARLTFEDRIEEILKELSEFQPTSVVACLGALSFEVLRYLPPGVRRVGMVQSDDPGVYRVLAHYREWLDDLVGVSSHVEATLREQSPDKRVVHLPYGIPIPEASRSTSATEPLRIIYLGRLEEEQKRVRLFPEIFRQLRAASVPFEWTIAGEGSEREFLENELRSEEDARVHVTGPVTYRDVPDLIARQDLFLLASDYEGLPLSLLEAMAAGLVPVVSDLPSGMRQVIDTTSGFLIPPDNTEGYVEAITHLHTHREELAEKSANARRKVIEEYSVEAMTDRWLKEVFTLAPTVSVIWPKKFRIQPIHGEEGDFRYSFLGRFARTLKKRLKSSS